METMMAAGIPFFKVDYLRPLLEREGHCLISSENLGRAYIPLIHDYELNRLRGELAGKRFLLTFDGTTRLGEAVNFIIRFVSGNMTIEQRLVRFVTAKKHMDGNDLFRLAMTEVIPTLRLNMRNCVGISRDSCSTNGVAVRCPRAAAAPHARTTFSLCRPVRSLLCALLCALLRAWLLHKNGPRLLCMGHASG